MSPGQLRRKPGSGDGPDDESDHLSADPTRPSATLRVRRLRAVGLFLALVLAIWGCVQLIGTASDHDTTAGPSARVAHPSTSTPRPVVASRKPPEPTAASSPSPQSDPTITPLIADPLMSLAASVATRSKGIGGNTAVGVRDLTTGVTKTYRSNLALPTASIVKVDILATLLLQTGGDPTEGQEALARRMIRESDNDAADALWNAIGGAPGLNAGNRRLGLEDTTPGTEGHWGLTTTTVDDQLRLLSNVFTDDSPLSKESRSFIRTQMGAVEKDQQWGVSAADDPGGDRFYVKNGWLPRSNGWIVNSIGQVEHDGHHLLVVVLSDGRPSEQSGIRVLEAVSADGAKAAAGG